MYQTSNDLWPHGEKPAQALCAEDERLSVLAAHGLQALSDDPELSRIAGLAARVCDVPIALVSIVEKDRQRFLAHLGLEDTQTPRSVSFCAHAMLGSTAMVVPDAQRDPRFANNALVTGEPHIRFYAGHPLVSNEGAPLGSLCVIDTKPRPEGLTDLQLETLAVLAAAVMRRLVSQRQHTEAEIREALSHQRTRQVLDSVPGIAWSADAGLNFDYFNARWTEATGAEPPTTVDEWSTFIHADDFAERRDNFLAATSAGEPFESEMRILQSSGEWRWMLSRVVPITTPDGELRWVGTLTDIHEEHRQREAKDLLANELSHRIKNIFAVISGLVAIRSRGRAEVADFAKELGEAIRALGTAHDYVRPVEGRSSDCLQGLLRDLLAPYDSGAISRVDIAGDDVAIGARAATPLALIFHELATNSAKYGALACDEGRIAIAITHDGDDLHVAWRETMAGMCDEIPSGSEGFGSRLLRLAVEGQLGGQFERTLGETGLAVDISFPAEAITG